VRVLGPVLALDLGARRIGVAVSDPDGRFAFPAPALFRSSPHRDLEALQQLASERKITQIVVGLPIHLDGRAGPEAAAARTFARELSEATGLPVDLLDERWTSREAERALAGSERGRSRRETSRKNGELDSAAAAILLRTWLARESARALSAERRQ
jgi:putative Holliday junction resolvase